MLATLNVEHAFADASTAFRARNHVAASQGTRAGTACCRAAGHCDARHGGGAHCSGAPGGELPPEAPQAACLVLPGNPRLQGLGHTSTSCSRYSSHHGTRIARCLMRSDDTTSTLSVSASQEPMFNLFSRRRSVTKQRRSKVEMYFPFRRVSGYHPNQMGSVLSFAADTSTAGRCKICQLMHRMALGAFGGAPASSLHFRKVYAVMCKHERAEYMT